MCEAGSGFSEQRRWRRVPYGLISAALVVGMGSALTGCSRAGSQGVYAQAKMASALSTQSLSDAARAGSAGGYPGMATGSVVDALPADVETKSPGGQVSGGLDAVQQQRDLIQNASITVETRDARKAADRLTAALLRDHGYVASLHETVDDLGARSVVIEMRVPFNDFGASMGQIETLGRVLSKEVTAEDVTEEYVDSQARLRNLQRTEDRLLGHMNQAGKLSDILLVEHELNRVRESIEELQGRLRYLAHRVEYSSITITLTEAARPRAVTPPESYSSGKVASDAIRSLIGFAQAVWSDFIWVAVWAVLWLPAAVLIVFAWRRFRRRRR